MTRFGQRAIEKPTADDMKTAVQPAGSEKRRASRKSVRTAGLLRLRHGRDTVPCAVLDVSQTGARLKLQIPEPKPFGPVLVLPDRVVLVMKFDRIEVDCEIAWRKGNDLGVRYLSPPRALAAPKR